MMDLIPPGIVSFFLLTVTLSPSFAVAGEAAPTSTPWPMTKPPQVSGGASHHYWYDEYVQLALGAHNEARWVHGNSPVKWDPILAQDAEHWARNSQGVGHSKGWIVSAKYRLRKHGYTGENLWSSWGRGLDRRECLLYGGADAVNSWYGEIKGFDFDHPKSNHMTQVLYELTHSIGCGTFFSISSTSAYCTTVCHYQPGHGGGMTTNVPRPVAGRTYGNWKGYGYFPGLQILFDHPISKGFECSYSIMGQLTRSIVHPLMPKDWVDFFCNWPQVNPAFAHRQPITTTKKPKKP